MRKKYKYHVRSDKLYPHLLPGKIDTRMTRSSSYKEPSIDKDPKPKLQSLHLGLNGQYCSE